ncbi:Bacterial protein of unknown function (HtrL_YibB) [uncultured virus]|nr:Bacterial protein of unknown function (HtrL_YibB) [uncultured virus]
MVIFIPDDLQDYVSEHRPDQYATKVIVRKFEDLAAYKYHDRIQSTIDDMVKEPNKDGSIPVYFADCPEFITAKYETIIFSKFDFLKEVSDENPFGSEYFIWLDAGTFYQKPPFNYQLTWPDPYKIRLLGDKFLVSDYKFDRYNTRPLADKRSYLRLNQNEICAYVLGGSKRAIDRVHEQFWREVNLALDMGVINNEQHFLQLMALQHPDDYYCWYRTRYQYPNLPVPLRDRMIPAELAKGTFIGENYPMNPNVKLLTVATKEIPEQLYYCWESTAKYYGYDYSVVGRDKRWAGFGTKIRIFYDALKTICTPYVVMTDCVDAFLTGSSDELYDKFLALEVDLIVGGEMQMYYPGGRNDSKSVRAYMDSIKESSQGYPNSGFLMGKTSEMLKLMELHLSYNDDQGACFDTIYNHKMPLAIDYKTDLVGNIPGYLKNGAEAIDYFEFDSTIGRYRNKTHGTLPVVLHFPGKNIRLMQTFYATTHPELVSKDNSAANVGWILLAVLLILIILIIIGYLIQHY